MSKHTPGPWDWRDGDELRQAKSTRDDGRYGAQVIGAGYDYDRGAYLDMTDADRDLIAAAPDLLKLAEALVQSWEACADGAQAVRHNDGTVIDVRKLIARATGEP